jgi:hypothetical protein
MRTALAVAVLLLVSAVCFAQAGPANLESLNATPEQVAPLKAVLDDLWAKGQAQDTAGVTSLLHEKSAFWQMEGPQSAKLIHRDALAELLTGNPMPEGITLGEAKAWVSGDVALVGAPIVGLPAEATGGRTTVLGAIMVRTADQWQIVTADMYDPDLETPAFEGAEEADNNLMQAGFKEFQQSMMAQGAAFLFGSLESEGVVVAWTDDEQRLVVMQPKELQGMLDMMQQVDMMPAADPGYFSIHGGGVAVMAANVTVNAMGISMDRRLILCVGYQPQDGKWRLYGVAAVPRPG